MVELEGVEFVNGGQYDTENAVLKFNNINQGVSTIKSSSFHRCKSFCVLSEASSNIEMENNVFYEGRLIIAHFRKSEWVKFEHNLMIAAILRPTLSAK